MVGRAGGGGAPPPPPPLPALSPPRVTIPSPGPLPHHPLQLVWLSYDGAEQVYNVLESGAETHQGGLGSVAGCGSCYTLPFACLDLVSNTTVAGYGHGADSFMAMGLARTGEDRR